MTQSSHPSNAAPVEQTSPEEDATLLAIEALEAQVIDPNPGPLVMPTHTQPTPTPPVIDVVKPVAEPATPPTPPPVPAPAPEPVEVKPTPPVEPREVKPVVASAPIIPEPPKRPATPAEEMAEELAHAPAFARFQFFLKQKAPRKPFIILGVIVVVIGIAAAAYFAFF